MSDWDSIQALLEKHAPSPKPRLAEAAEIRRAVIRAAVVSGRKTPEHIVKMLYADYLKQGGVRAVSRRFGIGRTQLRRVFARHGLVIRQPRLQPVLIVHGIKYSLKSDGGGYRRTRRGQQHMSLHRDTWERANGLIPPDMMVTAKDGDITNYSLENLVLLRRADFLRIMTRRRESARKRACIKTAA